MKHQRTTARRATLIGAGLAMATSIGLAGADMASAATPLFPADGTSTAQPAAQKLSPGSWTYVVKRGGCEVLAITASGTFTADRSGDAGIWAGGGSTVALSWTAGGEMGSIFSGLFVSSPVEYKGSANGGPASFGTKAKLVKGALTGC
jgi:hypothetical protein